MIVAQEFDFDIFDMEKLPKVPLLEDEISTPFLRRYHVVPLDIDHDILSLAVCDPFDPFIRHAFQVLSSRHVRYYLARQSTIADAISRLYGENLAENDTGLDQADARSGDADPTHAGNESTFDAPVIALLNQIVARSVDAGASDIHFEMHESGLHVRHRLDGILYDVENISVRLSSAIISRIKIIARLNIAERRLPQDGRVRLTIRGKPVDFRIATTPILHGERIVMRILDRDTTPKSLDQLGLSHPVLIKLRKAIDRPSGIVLVTGPTGSGKTTTLYASLLTLPAKSKNIMTVEDPVEYQLSGISQIQVKPQIDLTFANVLRSMLRQDPDIMLVGEIRDRETAAIAVQAALTGHLVLSTLHTTTSAGAITRLLDMGVDDYLLSSVIEGIVAQRLVRKLCSACKRRLSDPEALPDFSSLSSLHPAGHIEIYGPTGCKICNGTGYRGRCAISEIMIPSQSVRRKIIEHASEQEIQAVAHADGMAPMYEDGLQKVLEGVTSLDEIHSAIAEMTKC
jgi:general secretion pathway protein E